jgi:rare lipoprotein A
MAKQTSIIIRITVFLLVMLTVMSISFLVEAQDMPIVPVRADEQHSEDADVSVMRPMDLLDLHTGLASWYGSDFHGRRTASGRRYDMHELTAAHRTLPFGSLVRVLNEKTGKTILVEITDRGPFIRRRVIDLSYAAAKELGVSVTPVSLEAIRPADIADQYTLDPSQVIVIDADHAFHVAPADAVDVIGEPTSFTKAMRSIDESTVIVVVPAENGKGYRYAAAKVTGPTKDLDTIAVASLD